MLRPYLIVTLLGLAGFAQLPAPETPCLRRTLPLTITDSKGFPMHDPTVSDFQAKLRGRPVKILSITPDDRPHRIVILVDVSGSMATEWMKVFALALALAEAQLPNAQVALVIFGEKTYEVIGFSQGQTVVAERLRQIRSSPADSRQLFHERTAIFDSLLAGLQLLDTPTSADNLYLISDGGENASHAKFDDVARRLTSSGIRLFVSVIGGRLGNRGPTPEELDGRRDVSHLVKRTGGDIIFPFGMGVPTNPKEAERIAKAMALFHRQMIQNYRMEVELPGPEDKPRTLELKPSVENKAQWKNARVMYPAQISPCKP